MSEFCCVHGHLIPPWEYFCPICGQPIHTMDGKTSRQLQREEEVDELKEEEEINEENE